MLSRPQRLSMSSLLRRSSLGIFSLVLASCGGGSNGGGVAPSLADGTARSANLTRVSSAVLPPALHIGEIVNLRSGCSAKLLDVSGSDQANGATVHIWSANGGLNQQFKIAADADGVVLIAQHSGKVLDVKYANASNGNVVWQYEANGSKAQRWYVVDTGDGTYKLVTALDSGKVLDVNGAAVNDGAAVQVWEDNGSCAQRWIFQPQGKEAAPSEPSADNIVYPNGTPGVYNVRNYGAKGDGVTDDTAAIQAAFRAIDDVPYSRPNADFSTIYLPNGIYLISDTIQWRNYRVLQGQSESGVIIRLRDAAVSYADAKKPKPVIRCIYSNNESIGNYVRNLTVDTGKSNPGAVGIRYNAHNDGIMEHITIRSGDGAGSIGLDLAETEFGPALIRFVSIEGFDVGIATPGAPSHATLSHIRLKGQRVAGIRNFLPLSVQDLQSTNAVPAIVNGDGNLLAQLTLIGAKLNGGSPAYSAIENRGTVYLSTVTTSGYASAIKSKEAVVAGSNVSEFIEGEKYTLFPSKEGHIGLTLEPSPEIFNEPVSQWVVPATGANGDSTADLQRAIDSGAQTIFLPYGANYNITDTVIVRGNIRRIVGMFRSSLSGPIEVFRNKPMLRIVGNGRYPVSIESITTSTYPNSGHVSVEVASAQPVYLQSVNGLNNATLRNTGEATGRLFMDNTRLLPRLVAPANVQARQFNPENNPYDPAKSKPVTYVVNDGAKFLAFGWKSEAPAVHAQTTNGGQTEVLGGFFRDFFDISGVPYFDTTNADVSASYYQYATGCGDTRTLHARENRAADIRELRLLPNCSRPVALYSGRRY